MKKLIFAGLLTFVVYLSGFSQQINSKRVIHVFVALCDNEHQGIVPVPTKLGDGKDPNNNLYWGAAFGVKTFFAKQGSGWKLIKTTKDPRTPILERVIFKNEQTNTYLIADAYDGEEIRQSIIDFLKAASGQNPEKIVLDDDQISAGGDASLVAYIGHNGLMDFTIEQKFIHQNDDALKKDVIILACYSKSYFKSFIKSFGANPLVWSNGLMSPEAYTLKWAIDGWLIGEGNGKIVQRARNAYNHYQKCGLRGATNLLVTGLE